jgi:ribonucleoside-diphosphate reductase alpha chain
MQITKRDGTKQELDLNKIHAVLTWACEGQNDDALNPIKGVSISQIEMNAQLHFYDGMPTKQIHETLIKAASELISEDFPNYDQVAARLVWFAVRKEAFSNNLPPHLSKVIHTNIANGVYSKDILDLYTEEELDELNGMIDHRRDDLFKYAGAEQMRKKYLVQNRKTKKVFESFQYPYIMVAALLFGKYPKNTRMKYVKKYYDLISQHYISLPTPIMAGLRTKVKQFSSCTLIEAGDSLKSINAAAAAIVDYASRKAGIGLNIGSIRAEGQKVRGGDAVTTGMIPFAKYFNGALKSCSQGAVRGASATFNYPVWHLEFERLIELKNNKGTEETRLRTVDYCVHLNKLFYERLVKKGDITFFSPEEVPDLYKAFYSSDYKEFERLYKHYEKSPNVFVTKKTMPAVEVFTKIMQERFETGRIYIMNADHVNTHGSFYEAIKMTNLCTEITLPTEPVTYPGDTQYAEEEGLIALCTLSAVNWGKFTPFGELDPESSTPQRQESKLKDTCEMAVRGLDALLDYQDYPVEAARRHSMRYRPLGIGIIGFAHWLAKGRLYWGEENTLAEVEKMMEKMAYYLTEASIDLAEEFGSIPVKTKYHDGVFPIDTSVLKAKTQMDWGFLKGRAKKHGIRNATLMALMPSETSSQLSNETNGIEPPRDMVSIKGSKEGVLPQIVPEYAKLNAFYQTLWQVPAQDYLKTIAVLQKYIDQAISVNTSYDPSKGEIKMSRLIEDLLFAYKLGHKTLYYSNTRDGSGDEEEDDCESGACKI